MSDLQIIYNIRDATGFVPFSNIVMVAHAATVLFVVTQQLWTCLREHLGSNPPCERQFFPSRTQPPSKLNIVS